MGSGEWRVGSGEWGVENGEWTESALWDLPLVRRQGGVVGRFDASGDSERIRKSGIQSAAAARALACRAAKAMFADRDRLPCQRTRIQIPNVVLWSAVQAEG